MAFKTTNSNNYTLEWIAGDTEYIKLNVRDESNVVLDVSANYTCAMTIKRKETDTAFIGYLEADMSVYHVDNNPSSIVFEFTPDDTTEVLNYNGKTRKKLECIYTVELSRTDIGYEYTNTILSGDLIVTRTINGSTI